MCSYCQIVKFYLLLHFHTFCKNLVNLGGLDTGQHCCKRFMIVENSCVADCTATNNAEIVICADTCLLISSTLFACLCRCHGFWTRPKQNFSFWEQNNRCTYFPGLLSFIVVNLWHYIWLLSFQIMQACSISSIWHEIICFRFYWLHKLIVFITLFSPITGVIYVTLHKTTFNLHFSLLEYCMCGKLPTKRHQKYDL